MINTIEELREFYNDKLTIQKKIEYIAPKLPNMNSELSEWYLTKDSKIEGVTVDWGYDEIYNDSYFFPAELLFKTKEEIDNWIKDECIKYKEELERKAKEAKIFYEKKMLERDRAEFERLKKLFGES